MSKDNLVHNKYNMRWREDGKLYTMTHSQFIGWKLQERRKELNLSRQDVMDKCILSVQYLKEIEELKTKLKP